MCPLRTRSDKTPPSRGSGLWHVLIRINIRAIAQSRDGAAVEPSSRRAQDLALIVQKTVSFQRGANFMVRALGYTLQMFNIPIINQRLEKGATWQLLDTLA
jgi:hypothetical protein